MVWQGWAVCMCHAVPPTQSAQPVANPPHTNLRLAQIPLSDIFKLNVGEMKSVEDYMKVRPGMRPCAGHAACSRRPCASNGGTVAAASVLLLPAAAVSPVLANQPSKMAV